MVKALVLGSGNCLASDVQEAASLFTADVVIAVNHAARDHPGRVDHWATMHPDLYPLWIEARRKAGHPPAGQYWHPLHRRSPIDSKPIASPGGSSGLLAVEVALELGCDRIVLAGIPMHQNARHYDDERKWTEARQYWPAWEKRADMLRDRVRSFSGWTLHLLGAPTKEWLDGDD